MTTMATGGIVLMYAGIGAGVFILLFVYLILIPLKKALSVLPAEYRLITPAQLGWLLCPIFNLIWVFWVVVRISKSFQQYFEARKVDDYQDCGRAVGIFGATVAVLAISFFFVTLLSMLFGVMSILCAVVYMHIVHRCKSAALSLG